MNNEVSIIHLICTIMLTLKCMIIWSKVEYMGNAHPMQQLLLHITIQVISPLSDFKHFILQLTRITDYVSGSSELPASASSHSPPATDEYSLPIQASQLRSSVSDSSDSSPSSADWSSLPAHASQLRDYVSDSSDSSPSSADRSLVPAQASQLSSTNSSESCQVMNDAHAFLIMKLVICH